jgi:hypothetical protein
MVVYVCNPSTQEFDAGGSLIQGQCELHSKTLSQTKTKRIEKKEWPLSFGSVFLSVDFLSLILLLFFFYFCVRG